jgi:hypothetical protein
MRRLRRESGQTTTEFLMISGLITAVAIFLLGTTYVPFRAALQDFTSRMLNDTLEGE